MPVKKTKTYNPKKCGSMLTAISNVDNEAQQIKRDMINEGYIDVSIETQILETEVYAKVSAA